MTSSPPARTRTRTRSSTTLQGQEQILYNEKKQQEKVESEGIPINKFLFVERGTQSKSSMGRGIETQTEGPPRGVFSGTINKYIEF